MPGGMQETFLEIYYADRSSDFARLSLQFRVGCLDAFVASPPKTISHEEPTARPWGSTYLYIRDPNDIQIIVYEGGL